MSTRTGRRFKGRVYKPRVYKRKQQSRQVMSDSEGERVNPEAIRPRAETGEVTMAQMLQELLAERKHREVELAEERRVREELRRREAELREEHRHREEASAKREEEMKHQMELLTRLVEGVNKQGDAALRSIEKDREVKVTKLTEADDIEAYLTTFERLMKAYEVPRNRWSYKLAPQLVGKAQQAYAAMSADESADYEHVKKAILRRYDINEESYRQRFRGAKRKEGETSRELAARLEDLVDKWMQGRDKIEAIKDLIVLEQLVETLPTDVRIFVKERKPETTAEAAKLADDYCQARKHESEKIKIQNAGKPNEKRVPRTCLRCGKPGHIAKDCWAVLPRPNQESNTERNTPARQARPERRGKDLKDVECFNCQQKGHYSSNCPQRALFCMERRLDYQGNSKITRQQPEKKISPGVIKPGAVEGKQVSNILLDTGCSRTIVKELVPQDKILQGEAVAIRCAHGDTVLYPLANVQIQVEGKVLDIEAAVSETLPMSVLLGTDIPELTSLLKGDASTTESESTVKPVEEQKADTALAIMTRAGAKAQKANKESCEEKQRQSGVQPKALEEVGSSVEETNGIIVEDGEESNQTTSSDTCQEGGEVPEWMQSFDNNLFSTSRSKPTLTRKEKRENNSKYTATRSEETPKNPLEMSSQQFIALQKADATLEHVRKAARGHPSTAGVGFFERDGFICRRWIPPGKADDDTAIEQLVLPVECRQEVLKIAHAIPIAGHLGKEKTARRVLQRFYWPTLYRDVAKFCQSCTACQKVAVNRVKRAPLVPLPIISEPFKRIAMDIVGPLPRSNSGKRYILVICDYATKYPEAVPLKSIEAPQIAEELIKLFSRVGIPDEILGSGKQFYISIANRDLQDAPCASNQDNTISPANRWPRREVQSNSQEHAQKGSVGERKRLGQVTPVFTLRLQRSPTSIDRILPL